MYEFRKARFAFSAVAALVMLLTLAGPADAGTLTVEAGSRHSGSFGLRVVPDATPAYVQSSHPSGEKAYRVRFYVNLRRLNLASNTSFDLFAAYDGADPLPSAAPTGNAVLRAAVRQEPGGTKVLEVFTRTDSGEIPLSSPPDLVNGWRAVEIQWSAATAAGADNGFVNLWLDGVAQTGATNLDSDAQVINYARWGSVTGATTSTPPAGQAVNSFRLDDFGSQRSGYLGLLNVFSDVTTAHPFWRFIQGLYAAEITTGCTATSFCPESTVTRDQMAVFLIRAGRGPDFVPPPATGVFTDVPANYWAASFIEQLRNDGITTGCAPGPAFCPGNPVTRAEMAVFLLRAKYGAGYTPPPATGTVFSDVPAGYWAAAWIEQLFDEGITTGCAPGQYCPDVSVTRGQMAAFLVRTFSFPTQEVGP